MQQRARNNQLSQIFEPTTRSKLTSQLVFSCICKRRVLSLLSNITVFTVIPKLHVRGLLDSHY